jgi:spore coat protein SA
MTNLPVPAFASNEKLRVAVILSGRAQFSVYFGGALTRWTHEVYHRLLSQIDVTVFGFPTDPATCYPLPHDANGWWRTSLALSSIPGLRRFQDSVWLWSLRKQLRTYEIIHIHNRPQWAAAVRRLGYKGTVVVHLQNDHLGHWTGPMLDNLATQLDAVVVCSTYLRDQFCPKSKAIAAKTHLIFNGVNTELFHPDENLREPKTIFFVGSFIPNKGVLELVKAYALLLDRHPDAKLVIGGSKTFGIEGSTPYTQKVRQLADAIRRDKGNEIQFIGYLHHDKDLPKWFQRATIFSCPSLFQEPVGLVNAEAMACATPVVGTNRGGVPEVLGNSGRVVNPENTMEFAAALDALMSSPEERIRLGRTGYERSREVFDWGLIAEQWLEFLQRMAKAQNLQAT